MNSSRFSLNNLTFGFTSFQLINPKRATARYSALLRATVRYPAKRKHTYCYILKFYCTFLMVFLQLLCHFRPFQVIPTKRATSALQRAKRYSALQRATARYSALSTKEKAYTIHTEVVRSCNVNSSRFP